MVFNDESELHELRLVKSITNSLIANEPFLESEREDIENILLFKIWESKKKYLSGSKASLFTYLYTILKRKALKILRDKTRDKRIIEKYLVSLEEKIGVDDDLTLADTIRDNQLETDLLQKIILKEEINTVLKRITPFQQDIVQLLGEGLSKTEIARHTNKPRTTINDEIKRIQNAFRKEGGLKEISFL